MITNDFQNKVNSIFPNMFNEVEGMDNANALAASEALWKTVSEKWVDTTHKALAPVKDFIVDVYPEMQVANASANPVVQLEVITSVGDALVNATDFNQSEIANKYVTCELNHISRPFSLSMYDLTHGERIESKLAAAAEAVAQGVYKQFVQTVKGAGAATTLGEMSPEVAASISGAFGADAETHALILDPVNYSKLVPTNGLSLNPETSGVYGIGKIYKSYIDGGETEGIAVTKNGVVGAVATKEVFEGLPGTSVKQISVAGIPMLVLAKFDFDTHTIKVSVETWCGFTAVDSKYIKTYKFGA